MYLSLRVPDLLLPMLRRWTVFSTAAVPHTVTDASAPEFMVRYRNPPGLWTSVRLSQVAEVQGARMIYLSGQTPTDENYKVRSSDFCAQANRVYDNIEIALKSVGAGLRNVVKTTTYVTDAAHIKDLREVRNARYKNLKATPANTLLIVKGLAEPEFLVEIDVVAAVPV